jgi:hypothetical protein
MFAARRTVGAISKSATAARVVVSPKVVVPAIQRAFISNGPARSEPVVAAEPTAIPQQNQIKAMMESIGSAVTPKKISPTLNKFTLDGKVAVVTG